MSDSLPPKRMPDRENALLRPCERIWGAATIIDSDPAEDVYFDAVYNPFRSHLWLDDPEWGVYHADGNLIDAAAYYRLPDKFMVGQSRHIAMQDRSIDHAPRADYVYGGPVILHYGHFITAALPRLWQIVRSGLAADTRIVCHSDHAPEDWFTRDYARTIFWALGLTPDRFIVLNQATRFKRLRVPRAAFEEQNYAHRVFADLCGRVARRIAPPPTSNGPIYLSKTRLRGATYRIQNEAAMDDAAAARGLTIVRPEELSFIDQVAVIGSSPVIVGTIGSGFHTALFCTRPPRVLALAYGPQINANYRLIDKLCGTDATYLYPAQGLSEKPINNVTFGYWLDNPGAVIDELLSFL